jgi:hypothetical protein
MFFPLGIVYSLRANWSPRTAALAATLIVVTAGAGIAGHAALAGAADPAPWWFGLFLANGLATIFVVARAAVPRPSWPVWLHALILFGWMPVSLFAILIFLRVLTSGWSTATLATLAAFMAWLTTFLWVEVTLPPPDWSSDTRPAPLPQR